MFNLFKSKPVTGDQVTLKIADMHCSSCAMSIDDALEELDGVHQSRTNFAQSVTNVVFDKEKISQKKLIETINQVGYHVAE